MADRPILFSAPMIRALLEGRKTQTRRVIKPQPYNSDGDFVDISIASTARYCKGADGRMYFAFDHPRGGPLTAYVARINVGDRLWVRETHIPDPPSDDPSWADNVCTYVEWSGCGSKISDVPLALRQAAFVLYAADDKWTGYPMQWKPSIHMPRWASRLTLIVTDVRVQRLQDISEEDAIAEGVTPGFGGGPITEDYLCLWNSIHGAFAADANPWVAAYTFRVIKGNIDQIEADHVS